jgi:TolB-like protein
MGSRLRRQATALGAACGAVLALAALAGCTEPTLPTHPLPYDTRIVPPHDADLVAASYAATDRLINSLAQPLDPSKPVLVASLVDIADLDRSSPLGQIIAEQVGSRLSQLGYDVVETRLRNTLAINPGGEFVLSRDVRRLGQAHAAQAVLAGTYAPGQNEVYISLRLIRATDARVLAGFDYALPAGPTTRSLAAAGP